jgi:hypothetical protein
MLLRGHVFGGWGDCAELRVLTDFFYGNGTIFGLEFGQVEAGDLEAVEQKAGAAEIDVVGGDTLEDFADGVLDGGAVFGQHEVEGFAALTACDWSGDRFAAGVVVVAKIFFPKRRTATTMASGKDVAALETSRLGAGICGVHGPLPWGILCKVFKSCGLGPDLEASRPAARMCVCRSRSSTVL